MTFVSVIKYIQKSFFKGKIIMKIASSNTNKKFLSSKHILYVLDIGSSSCSVPNSKGPRTWSSRAQGVGFPNWPFREHRSGTSKVTKSAKRSVLQAFLGDSLFHYYKFIYVGLTKTQRTLCAKHL